MGRGEVLAPAKGWGDFESPFQIQFIIWFCNLIFPGSRSGLALAAVRYSDLPPETSVNSLQQLTPTGRMISFTLPNPRNNPMR